MRFCCKSLAAESGVLGIRNGVGKQGRGNQPPPSTIRTRYRNSVSTSEAAGLAKANRILSEREAHKEFQYRPHILDMDTIADAVFCGRRW